MKKILSLLLVLTISCSTLTIYASEGDQPSSWARESVVKAIEFGIVPERLQSNYQDPITREEFSELLVNSAIESVNRVHYWWEEPLTKEDIIENVELEVSFEDADADHVKIAYILGSISGVSDTKFAPNNFITRQEAATMLINTFQMETITSYGWAEIYYKDADTIATWAKDAVDVCYNAYIMRGDGEFFNPNGYLTREQSILILSKIVEYGNFYSILRAKGIVGMDKELLETGFVVGKDYVYVKYSDLKDSDEDLFNHWRQKSRTNHITDPSFDQVRVAYQFRDILVTNDLPINIALNQIKAQLDYTFMKVSFWDDDYLIKFDLSPKKGYVSKIGGYYDGNPIINIEAKSMD